MPGFGQEVPGDLRRAALRLSLRSGEGDQSHQACEPDHADRFAGIASARHGKSPEGHLSLHLQNGIMYYGIPNLTPQSGCPGKNQAGACP
jgi:hypothetical protein